jgi:tRNA-binding protein
MNTINYDEFAKVELLAGTVVKAELFPRAKKPAFKVWVDFGGDIGIKQTSAQVTVHYTIESIIGKRVVGCVNLGTRNIGGFISEFLLVGFPDENEAIQLVSFSGTVPNGAKLI